MLSLIVHLPSLRWVLPIGFILGSAPNLFGLFLCLKILSIPLPRRVFEWGDEWVYAVYQRIILFTAENYGRCQLVLYGDAKDVLKAKENVIIMCNHQSEFDWIIINMLAARQGSLGHVRFTLKDGLRFLPMFGYYFRQHSCIYINKTGKFNESRCAQQLQELVTYSTPIWLVVFPEGSRFSSSRVSLLEKSKKFAVSQGLPVLHQVLSPRSKMLNVCVNNLRNYASAVYDVTTAYSDTLDVCTGQRLRAPGLSDVAMGSCPEIHVHIKRIAMSEIPQDQSELQQWLHQRYVEKDRLLQKFYSSDPNQQGRFEGEGQKSRINLMETLPAVVFFSALAVPMLFTETGRKVYIRTCLYGTLFGLLWMTVKR